jgi:hypothetical protein
MSNCKIYEFYTVKQNIGVACFTWIAEEIELPLHEIWSSQSSVDEGFCLLGCDIVLLSEGKWTDYTWIWRKHNASRHWAPLMQCHISKRFKPSTSSIPPLTYFSSFQVLLNLARVLFNLQYLDDAVYLTRRSLEVQPPDKNAWQQHLTLGEIFKVRIHAFRCLCSCTIHKFYSYWNMFTVWIVRFVLQILWCT